MSSENASSAVLFQPVAGTQAPAEDIVLSPCRRQCCLDDEDVCVGCGRLLSEIREWKAADSPRRREIIELALTRVKPSPFDQS
ncbi:MULTISPECIES: DUF1289 domain-containing protein [unclassified Pseudomonas]|jgi:predicted Fe-S protein YdhL (DUF1289 family)|uniref:DUF1289 domain-containing protein n=1 Tax=Pseudomonas sp. GV071 TaxID=2135754 RepID=UPI000D36058C|nr:uncharacterized protein DUF1289 [Pseudomonas sp. GV071]